MSWLGIFMKYALPITKIPYHIIIIIVIGIIAPAFFA